MVTKKKYIRTVSHGPGEYNRQQYKTTRYLDV